MNMIRVSNSLDQDQTGFSVGPNLGLNYSQKLTADDTWSIETLFLKLEDQKLQTMQF